LTASQVTAAQGVLSNGQVGIVVTATYNHTLQFFQAMMTPYLGSVLTASYTAVQLKGWEQRRLGWVIRKTQAASPTSANWAKPSTSDSFGTTGKLRAR
jgi:hypothetical protein